MKTIFPSTLWIIKFTSLWLGLAMILFIRPTSLASASADPIPSNQLYLKAFKYARNQDYIHATIYLFAYVQQNPPEYANNINGHATAVDTYLNWLLGETRYKADMLSKVETDLSKCKKYPCNQSDLDITNYVIPIEPLSAPPDAVIVCDKPKYKGRCSMLFVGDYRTHQSLGVPNDSIASVMVGSRVKITVYTDALGNPPMLTLTRSDSNLSNNLTSDGYPWSKVISTAKIEWK
jgi:hypothetical protein